MEDSVLESLGIQQLGDRVILKSLCKKAVKGKLGIYKLIF